jgi:hypothetical protein
MPLILGANSLAGGGYEIDNSLRFNSGSSDYLSIELQLQQQTEKLGHGVVGLKDQLFQEHKYYLVIIIILHYKHQ